MFYRGSIPPPLTVTPKFNYMEKELLTIELSHHDLAPETITIGIYDTIDEAVKEGNKALELLSRYFEVRKGDFFKTKGLFGDPCRLVTNCFYPTSNVSYYARITRLKFEDLEGAINNTFNQLKNIDHEKES